VTVTAKVVVFLNQDDQNAVPRVAVSKVTELFLILQLLLDAREVRFFLMI